MPLDQRVLDAAAAACDRFVAAIDAIPARPARSAGPYVCTAAAPWNATIKGRVIHPGGRQIGEQRDGYPGGDIVTMECTVCGHRWTMELPQ